MALHQIKDSEGGVWEGRLRASDMRRIEELVTLREPRPAVYGLLPGTTTGERGLIEPEVKRIGFDLTNEAHYGQMQISTRVRLEVLYAWLSREATTKGLTREQFEDLWDAEEVLVAIGVLEDRLLNFLSPAVRPAFRSLIQKGIDQMASDEMVAKAMASIGAPTSTGSVASLDSEPMPRN